MCNFIIRPIKSYATIDTKAYSEKSKTWTTIKRGDSIEPTLVFGGCVYFGPEDDELTVNLSDFVHTFTANPDDVDKVRKEEHETMGYNPNKK